MDKIESLVEKIYKDKIVSLDDIVNLNLDENEYNNLIIKLKKEGISIETDSNKEIQVDEDSENFSDDLVKQYLREIAKYPLLNSEEERELFILYKYGNEHAKKKILTSNLRLVVSIAKKYAQKSKQVTTTFLDLIQDGNEGLIKAIDKFDVSLGYKFSTYATWWIRQSITRAISDVGKTIRIPVHQYELYNKIKKYIETEQIKVGKEPTLLDVSVALNLDEEQVKYVIDLMENPVISLDEKVGEDTQSDRVDFVKDDEDLIDDVVLKKASYEKLAEIMKFTLTPREYCVISYRFGIVNEFNDSREIKTLKEVGEKFQVTRERVRQIEAKALRKLRLTLKREETIKIYKKW